MLLDDSHTDALTEPQALRLSMGELDAGELRLAQAAARLALARLGLRGWAVVPQTPDPVLLGSIAVRLDHALGVPGWYDQLHALARAQGLSLAADGRDGSHAQRIARAQDLARAAHAAAVAHGLEHAMDEAAITSLQEEIVEELANPEALAAIAQGDDRGRVAPREAAGIVRAAVRHAATHLRRHGLVALPEQPPQALVSRIAAVLKAHGNPGLDADARRIHEEIVGLGFYSPGMGDGPARAAAPRA